MGTIPQRSGFCWCLWLGLAGLLAIARLDAQEPLVALQSRGVLAFTGDAVASAEASVEHLRRIMDLYHDRFPVYEDVSSAGNHFHVWAKIASSGDLGAIDISGSSTAEPRSGATAIRCEFSDVPGLNWGGFYFLNGILPAGASVPEPNWGDYPDAGVELSGATAVTFWARGEVGGEIVEFFMGGVGVGTKPHPDSSPKTAITVALTTTWTQYTIAVGHRDLSYVLGGFGWVASDSVNPGGAVFHLDDIQYELGETARQLRLDQPRFLRSFATDPVQEMPPPVGNFDLQFRNAAITYDNALAILAFLAHHDFVAGGSADSLRRARLIGDAFVYATENDRSFTDGELRDIYAAGDIALPPGWFGSNGEPGSVPVPGYFDEPSGTFVENGQDQILTGNQAWAALALLALHEATGDGRYLDAARGLAVFIQTLRQETGSYQGFLGGYDGPETATPTSVSWASTEHNLDLYTLFSKLFGLTGEAPWQTDAQHARTFVEAMWDASLGCYLTGTTDPETRNSVPGQLPEDAQSWTVLAVPDVLQLHPDLLSCAETHHRVADEGFSGFDFNDDRDGVWFEGSAHMAVAYLVAESSNLANDLRSMLRLAQATPPYGDGFGIAATASEAVTTGFGTVHFFRRLHIAATAWNTFAQLGFNPFSAQSLVPELNVELAGTGSGGVRSSPEGIDCEPDCAERFDFGVPVTLSGLEDVGSGPVAWSGDPDCVDGAVDMHSDRACVATFDLLLFPLTVTRTGQGIGLVTSDPPGIDCGANCSADYAYGTDVQLAAVPAPDSAHVGWSGHPDCVDALVTVNEAKTCSAHFCLLDRILSGETLAGPQLFEACNSITAGPSFVVTSTAEVTLRAGNSVTLANGVMVESGAVLIVTIDPDLEQP